LLHSLTISFDIKKNVKLLSAILFFYSIIYKPFNVLCQFTSVDNKQCLSDYFSVPKDVYPVGRLDYDSEGLLLLTNDKKINHALLHPSKKHARTYWVQVDGAITENAILQLQKGVQISVDGKVHHTLPCKAALLINAPTIPERNPPIRIRKNIPTSWIELIVTEGKNRQVRKMTAAVGFPTLRLIRYKIEKCSINNMEPGTMQILTKQQVQEQFLLM
jgi:23S rRNA pseudouridine2457 synthase